MIGDSYSIAKDRITLHCQTPRKAHHGKDFLPDHRGDRIMLHSAEIAYVMIYDSPFSHIVAKRSV
jgi:hypothetical protein